jgi:hypothetical protein
MRDVQKFLGKIKDKLLKLIIKLKIEEVSWDPGDSKWYDHVVEPHETLNLPKQDKYGYIRMEGMKTKPSLAERMRAQLEDNLNDLNKSGWSDLPRKKQYNKPLKYYNKIQDENDNSKWF